MAPLTSTDLPDLADRLASLDRETTWAEFKENNADPVEIGEYISALANSAALEGRRSAYMMWGVRDADHEVVGTSFRPATRTISGGGEELENFLLRHLTPQVFFRFHTFQHRGRTVVILEIEPPSTRPVRFQGTEYIRVGSYKKKLRDHSDHERRLWRLFDTETFENSSAADRLSIEQVVQMIDYPSYFRLSRAPLPENRSHIIEVLEQEGILSHDIATDWSVTNRGASLFANDLEDFRASCGKLRGWSNTRESLVSGPCGSRLGSAATRLASKA